MNIKLSNVIPFPLKGFDHSSQSIWGNQVELIHKNKVLLNASSGKGKSTFTMAVTGLRSDFEGSIFYDDTNIQSINSDEWVVIRQRKISVVFQDLQLFPNLTVGENLILKNQLTDFKSENEIREMLDLLEIEHKWNDQIRILSMGQQQRVAIIRALCQPFEWIIMDEPFSHLDNKNSRKCLDMISNECDTQNAGFVLTSLDADNSFPYNYELSL